MAGRKRKADLALLKSELKLTDEQEKKIAKAALNITTIRRAGGWQADVMLGHALVVIKNKENNYGVTVIANRGRAGNYFFKQRENVVERLMGIVNYGMQNM